MEFDKLKRKTLQENCRNNSLEHVLNLLENEDKKVLVEFGTLRAEERPGKLHDWENNHSHEGYSTLLFATLSMIGNKKFYSVDIMPDSISVSKSVLRQFNENLLNHVEYINKDQNVFLKEFEDDIDFLYIDAAQKPEMLSESLTSGKLSEGAIILIDDMTEPWIREACIEVVNKNDCLHPIDRIDFFPQNNQEIQYQKLLISQQPFNNFIIHKSGVQQYPTQILLRYSKK